ncbi:MAG: hypothetical protein WD969_12995 [Paracoccaceae bacterium]
MALEAHATDLLTAAPDPAGTHLAGERAPPRLSGGRVEAAD